MVSCWELQTLAKLVFTSMIQDQLLENVSIYSYLKMNLGRILVCLYEKF